MREQKTFHFQVKTVDDEQGLVEAYASVFDVVDEGDGYIQDIVRKGAFTRTIKNSKAKIAAGKAKFLATMLWSHEDKKVLPVGGWYDLKEDDNGLLGKAQIVLATQIGREVYELIKAGVINQFSIGYDIPSGGSNYDSKSGIRELTEIRLWEISPVVFAMNQEALLVDVKSLDYKSVCGNTSGPIGPRNESWDGGKAKGQIWTVAYSSDSGKINTTLAKKYFMVCDGDPQKKGSYNYPFWYVGSSPHICVGAVIAIAGAIGGARGADAPDGLKGKVETLYRRINSKYSDDPELTPKWKDDGKAMNRELQKKTFAEHYAEEMCEDLLEDWQDVVLSALTASVLDAFKIGDTPESDIRDALTAFNDAVMQWVAQGIEYKLPDYLDENTYSSSSTADYLMQYGSESKPDYGYMSRHRSLSRKAGRAISASNAGKIQDHIDSLNDLADAHATASKTHTKALRSVADDLATVLQGSEAAYGSDTGKPDEGQQEGKNRGTPSEPTCTTHEHSSLVDTATEQDISNTIGTLRAFYMLNKEG